jgi:hypothetical protein
MNTQQVDFTEKGDLAERLDQIGWGVFLIMIATIWLLPGVPQGTWLVGTGVLLLLLNAVRSRMGVRWSGISVALGIIALMAGISDMTGIRMPVFPIALLVVGIALVLKPLVGTKV